LPAPRDASPRPASARVPGPRPYQIAPEATSARRPGPAIGGRQISPDLL